MISKLQIERLVSTVDNSIFINFIDNKKKMLVPRDRIYQYNMILIMIINSNK